VILTILIGTVPYYLLKSIGPSLLPAANYPYLWVVGILYPQGFFIPFTALLIAAGSMPEEYEQGTAEILLSKPVTRDEYLLGKYTGGFMLLTMVILLNAALSLALASFAFGSQLSLDVFPFVVLSQVFSSLLFYSVAFMSGELVRRSSLSYIIASAVYFASEVSGIFLRVIYNLTRNPFYQNINVYLPTTPVSSLPVLVAKPGLPVEGLFMLNLIGINASETSIAFSVALIAAYTLVALLISRIYFNWADVAKRIG
jgi:ABC-2 type transport system permease protein